MTQGSSGRISTRNLGVAWELGKEGAACRDTVFDVNSTKTIVADVSVMQRSQNAGDSSV